MKYSERIQEFLNFLRVCQQDYSVAAMQEKDTNDETQDLLHCLELNKNGYHDLARISKVLRKVRRERREAKNQEWQLRAIVEWVNENRKTINELERLLGIVRKAEKSIDNRLYTPKTDILSQIFGSD